MIDKFLMTAIPQKGRYYLLTTLSSMPIVIGTLCHTILLAYIIDSVFLKHKTLKEISVALFALFLSFALKPVFQYLHEKNARKMASNAKRFLRNELTEVIQNDQLSTDNEKTTGLYATLACEGIESTDAYFAEFVPQLFLMAINTLLLLLTAFYLDFISALIMLITAPLIPIFMILIGKTAEGVNLKQWDSLKRMNGHLLDLLRGIQTLRSFSMDIRQIESVKQTSEGFKNKTLQVLKLSFLSAFALELTATLSTAMIAVSLGVRLLYGQISFFNALAILLLAPEYYLPLRQLGLKYHAAMNAKGISKQLKPLVEAKACSERSLSDQSDSPRGNDLLKHNSSNDINLEHISFSYGMYPVFNNFSALIPSQQATAITGISGAGKSTLLKLIAGELRLSEGNIYYGSESTEHWTHEDFASQIAFVPQHPKVFKGTILENLRLGNPTAQLSEVLKACQLTGFNEVLTRLPLGHETLLGDGIQSLSGGETQLLALTRAVIRETSILLLDEPSSALDPLSEERLANALQNISKSRTLIIAAHREATIKLCQNLIDLKSEVVA